MPKFVLIDPSVQDFQGHYCEYAMRVLKSAETRGYLPVLAANRRFRASDAVDAKVCPVYRYAFWFASTDEGLLRWLRNRVKAVERRWTRLKVRLCFSRLGLLWILRRVTDWVLLPGTTIAAEIARDRNVNAAWIEGIVSVGMATTIFFVV